MISNRLFSLSSASPSVILPLKILSHKDYFDSNCWSLYGYESNFPIIFFKISFNSFLMSLFCSFFEKMRSSNIGFWCCLAVVKAFKGLNYLFLDLQLFLFVFQMFCQEENSNTLTLLPLHFDQKVIILLL